MEQRYVIKYLHRKKTKTEDIVKELKDVYGKEALSRSRVYYWVKEIKLGREDLNDLPRSGRPIDEQLINTIQDHITNEPFASARKMALELNISHDTVRRCLIEYLGMKSMNLKWVPHLLTHEQKENRVLLSMSLLGFLRKEEASSFEFILTGDESWFTYVYQHNKKWVIDNDELDEKVESSHYSKKTMFTIFLNGKGLQLIDVKPPLTKIDSNYFITNILHKIEESDLMIKSKKWKRRLYIHYDNAPSHSSRIVKDYVIHSKLKILDHPAYSPDLSICDFGIFGTLKNSLVGNEFESEDELFDAIHNFFESKSETFFKSLFYEWMRRLEACISNGGNYVQ